MNEGNMAQVQFRGLQFRDLELSSLEFRNDQAIEQFMLWSPKHKL